MWSPTQYIWACQVLIPSVKTEVCFLNSVSEPTLIGTWYDQIYCRWTTHKHTCNIFLVFGWVWSINRCGHAEWHLQTTSCKVCFLISVSAHQHQSAPNMTIADKQTHITCYIKWEFTFRLRHINHFINNTLTCSKLLLFSVSIENPLGKDTNQQEKYQILH